MDYVSGWSRQDQPGKSQLKRIVVLATNQGKGSVSIGHAYETDQPLQFLSEHAKPIRVFGLGADRIENGCNILGHPRYQVAAGLPKT